MKDTIKDAASVVVPNGVVLGTVTFAQIEDVLKVALLVASLAYTLWKWRADFRKDKNNI